ncbi:MAG: hypothetical protein IAE82_13020 [Opitutaceae bacterium]|nr:hypothetical protein [Opitutaceae bacterium]
MTTTARARLARLHFINTYFSSLTGQDLYLASQMLAAMETVCTEEGVPTTSIDAFLELFRRLSARTGAVDADAGFAFCDGEAAGPLFLRAELLAALRRNAAKRRATIMVADVHTPAAFGARGRRSSRRTRDRDAEQADTVEHLRTLAARRANPRTALTMLFV